ncbi:MAG: hypothetical protein ACI9G6_001980, partial [Limisphaerales bacterium]
AEQEAWFIYFTSLRLRKGFFENVGTKTPGRKSDSY